MLVLEDVSTRPAPGPLTMAPGARLGPHHRDPADRGLCVCGDRWEQAMICHPCRMGDHLAEWCVDGPGHMAVAGGGRLVYTYGPGRWCNCGHHSPTARAVAGDGITTDGTDILRRTALAIVHGDDFTVFNDAGELFVRVDPARPDDDAERLAAAAAADRFDYRHGGGPAPYLSPALEAAAAEWVELGPGLVEFGTGTHTHAQVHATSIKLGPLGAHPPDGFGPPVDVEVTVPAAGMTARHLLRDALAGEGARERERLAAALVEGPAARMTAQAEAFRRGLREGSDTFRRAARAENLAEQARREVARRRHLLGHRAPRGVYDADPPAAEAGPGGFCGDVPASRPRL